MKVKTDLRGVIIERWDEFADSPWAGVTTLSAELGISRVIVWNNYARLNEARHNLGLDGGHPAIDFDEYGLEARGHGD